MDIIKGTSRDRELYVRNAWYVAAWSHELDGDALISRTIINAPVLLFRQQDGTPAALADQCCHRLLPLSRGRREGSDVRCMYHGLKFDATGRCIDIPGQQEIPEQFRVRAYPVVERHSWLWVWMGAPERADEALIAPAVGLDRPEYVLKSGLIDYQANYLLINDNLTDFSHLAYVHAKTFGGGSDAIARNLPKLEQIDRGIRVTRWTTGLRPRTYIQGGNGGSVDTWMSYDFLVPGILLMISEVHPGGTAQGCDFGRADSEPLHRNFTSQAVTPMTDDTSRYFFSWGPRAAEHARNPKILDDMIALAKAAFEEDRLVIEAQQRSIKLKSDTPINTIKHDRGPIMMRRIIERLIEAEHTADQGHTAHGAHKPVGATV